MAYRPADLTEVPAIDTLLSSLGMGRLRAETVRSVMGRNNNWIGTTDADREVFVKQLHEGDRDVRMQRTAHVAAVGSADVRMPRLLGVDEEAALIALEFLPGARTGAELAADGDFTADVAAEAGRQVAGLHRLDAADFDVSEHTLPPVRALDGLSLAYYTQASSAELEMWRLLQGDAELVAALKAMKAGDEQGLSWRTPIHGDLRLDQLLICEEQLYLSDFEESRVGDPARDLGAFAGEWLFLAASTLPSALAASLPVGRSATHVQIVSTGVAEIERRNPMVRAFLGAYFEARPQARADETLVRRATSYAGWHMLDRMLAGAANSNRLSSVNKAAAGIGRTLLLAPDDFASTLGLDA